MDTYINGLGLVSAQDTLASPLIKAVSWPQGPIYKAIEPAYPQYIPARQARRMSRFLKMSISAAQHALSDSKLPTVDAIITSTGLGCLQDSGKFLSEILESSEGTVSPTAFIQSTHNTIGGQLALILKNNGYNMTYSQKGHSFETGLQDALLKFELGEVNSVLLGGADEITELSYDLGSKLGLWKNSIPSSIEGFMTEGSNKTNPGEGASFFVLSAHQELESYAKIKDVLLWNGAFDKPLMHSKLAAFLETNLGTDQPLDLCLIGTVQKEHWHAISEPLGSTNCIPYKHLTGEYHTAGAFGVGLGASILKKQSLPDIYQNNPASAEPINSCLVYNNYFNDYHSLTLLEAVEV